jgi:uncharacterized membrane protein YccC
VPDWLPAVVNALRAFLTISAVELFWILTAWPNGAQAITFAAIGAILFAQRADQAYATTMSFMTGISLTAGFAAIVKFAVLPGIETFAGFSIAIGVVLVPAGALMSRPYQKAMFTAMAANFIPLLAPANEMSYDVLQFCNTALAIVGGVGAAALAFRVAPPLSPALRTRRLLALALRDLRRLAAGPVARSPEDWEEHMYRRLAVLPDEAAPVERAQLVAALSVGTETIRLGRIARRLGPAGLEAAFGAIARGSSAEAIERLAGFERMLAGLPEAAPGARVRLRARTSILALSEALAQHSSYFDRAAGP